MYNIWPTTHPRSTCHLPNARRMGAPTAPGSAPTSPRTVSVSPPIEEDLFVTPQRQAAAAVSLLLRLALWPLFLLRELIMLPRRCAAVLREGITNPSCCRPINCRPGRLPAGSAAKRSLI